MFMCVCFRLCMCFCVFLNVCEGEIEIWRKIAGESERKQERGRKKEVRRNMEEDSGRE